MPKVFGNEILHDQPNKEMYFLQKKIFFNFLQSVIVDTLPVILNCLAIIAIIRNQQALCHFGKHIIKCLELCGFQQSLLESRKNKPNYYVVDGANSPILFL